MKITLNGKSHDLDGEDLSVSELVSRLEIGRQPVLVELNGSAILVREFDETTVREGDVVEVIRMVAGG